MIALRGDTQTCPLFPIPLQRFYFLRCQGNKLKLTKVHRYQICFSVKAWGRCCYQNIDVVTISMSCYIYDFIGRN